MLANQKHKLSGPRDLCSANAAVRHRIHCGDALDVLKSLNSESVDLVCTDPPYGISFMGKAWDKRLPRREVFEECLRVLKPGAFAFVMCSPRSDVCARMMLTLEEAGFDIGFTPIYWTYASGFPKALNIGKAIDKREGRARQVLGRNPNSRERATAENSLYHPGTVGKSAYATSGVHPLEGSYGGFQPKPAVEVVIAAMKPLAETTFVAQALRNGKGVTWLDDCRIPVCGEAVPRLNKPYKRKGGANFGGAPDGRLGTATGHESSGRFPANLIVSDGVLGAHSRFFSLDAVALEALPFLPVPKASKREKNAGLEHFGLQRCAGLPLRAAGGNRRGIGSDGSRTDRVTTTRNGHPTVKPLKLMQYLVVLGSRPGDVVLDPFLGSGTTAMAAKSLGRHAIGIERERGYVEIAKARIAWTASGAGR